MLNNFCRALRPAFINKFKLCRSFSNVVSSSNILNSEKITNSTAIKSLFDRYLLSCTFPVPLLKKLNEFDSLPPIVYAGFDPTSDSLHIGNLLILNTLLHLYSVGFEVIVLIGGATCKLGDPSGRNDVDRPSIEWPIIMKNSESLLNQIEALFSNYTNYIYKGKRENLKPVRFVNNAKWYANLNVISFLDKYGRLFRVSHFLDKSIVRERISGHGMNINEFMYQLFQAYDFLRLYEEFGCLIQLGGSDQVGNVHSGHDIIRKVHDKNAVGIFSTILASSEGEKLGKSVGNALLLNPTVTSSFEFYQHFLRLHDTELQKNFYLFTFLPTDYIDQLCDKHMKNPEKRVAQRKLAEQVTLLVHGESGLNAALNASKILYENKIEPLLEMTPEEIDQSFKGVPSVQLTYRNDFTLLELISAIGKNYSESYATDLIVGGGIYVNLIRIYDPNCVLVKGTHILPNNVTLLRIGKRDYILIRWSGYD